jgi:tRNA dimethylallyltransferase
MCVAQVVAMPMIAGSLKVAGFLRWARAGFPSVFQSRRLLSFDVIAVLGPTASGKSELAVGIAARLIESGQPAEIINADAMQLYKGMDIGTAKLLPGLQQGIQHHLIDQIGLDQEMTAVEYQGLARAKMLELLLKGVCPILVGGSMFYVAAALDQLDFAPTDPEIRRGLEELSKEIGALELHRVLEQKDPVAASRIPAQNIRRVVRALEVIEITGESYLSALPQPKYWRPTLQLGISVERDLLKARIQKRVLGMWEKGLLQEAQGIIQTGSQLSRTAKMAIGYAQAFSQLQGDLTEQEAQLETISLTNRYARRQMSWFRRDQRINWVASSDSLLEQSMNQIRLAR